MWNKKAQTEKHMMKRGRRRERTGGKNIEKDEVGAWATAQWENS